MRWTIFLSVLSIWLAAPAARSEPAVPAAQLSPAVVPGAYEYRLPSRYTGKTYRIQVAAVGPAPAQGYPVLYVLDGDAFFPVAAMAAQGMWMRAEENGAVPMLLVGVGYSDWHFLDLAARAEDYTPPSEDYSQTGDRLSRRFGGADAFHRFLTEELRPDLAHRFPLNPQQQNLFGHSYGGLFALYSLMKYPASFRNRLAASPSIWWNQRRILQEWPAFSGRLAAAGEGRFGLRLSAGQYEETLTPHLPRSSQRQAVLSERAMVSEVQHFGAQLLKPQYRQLSVETVTYPEETHASVALLAIGDGIRWLYARCREDAGCRPPLFR